MRFLTALVLVDLPVIVGVAAFGWAYGYHDTYTAVMDYRTTHLWTWLPSLLMLLILVRRRRHG